MRQLGIVLWVQSLEQGKYAAAEKVGERAKQVLQASGVLDTSPLMIQLFADQAAVSLLGGDWNIAVEHFQAARRASEKLGSEGRPARSLEAVDSYLTGAVAYLRLGRTKEAIATLRAAIPVADSIYGRGEYVPTEARVLASLAALRLGVSGDMETHIREIIPQLTEKFSTSFGQNGFGTKRKRLEFIAEEILKLADARQIDGDHRFLDLAFATSVFAQTSSVSNTLAASLARSKMGPTEVGDLARQEQDIAKKILSIQGALASYLGSRKGKTEAEDKVELGLRARIFDLSSEKGTLRTKIESLFPDYVELITPGSATIEQARAVLRPGEALISTYSGIDRTFVWAIPFTGDVAFSAVDLGREDLSDTVGLLRSALEPNARTLGDIPEFDLAAASNLFTKLLEPVRAGWKDADSLLVVAHGPLGYLPFSVLPTDSMKLGPDEGALFANYREVRWLARSHAVTMLPSVASLIILRGLPPGNARRKAFAGFGDPWFSEVQAAEARNDNSNATQLAALSDTGLATRGMPVHLRAAPNTMELDSADLARLPRLPDTADEIRSTAVALKADLATDVFLGPRANEQMVKTMDLSGRKVLAFATHGLVPGDLNGLTQPALALSAPEVAGIEGDGLLTMGEILGLKLDADWVVLSACNTGSGEGAGAEAVSGLGRAFFYAGTRALLVSNWPVETTSAKTLTTDLFRRQAEDPNLTRAEALRQSMLKLVDGPGYVAPESGKTVFSYAHPIFWAPFSLIGDGGGATPAS